MDCRGLSLPSEMDMNISRLLQRRNSTKPPGWDCREMQKCNGNVGLCETAEFKMMRSNPWNSKWITIEHLRFSDDQSLWISFGSMGKRLCWILWQVPPTRCCQLASWRQKLPLQRGESCWDQFPIVTQYRAVVEDPGLETTSQVNNLGSHVRWTSSLYPLVI